jgi:phosphatidylglycerophosphate synthase
VKEANVQMSPAVRADRPAMVFSDSVGKLRGVPGILMMWTLGRLLLIPIVIAGFILSPALCVLTLIVFVGADIYDGVLARALNADDPARRALDSIVDRVSVWTVLVILSVLGYLNPILLALLMVRDLYCAWWCYQMVSRQRVAIKADWLHRGLNLAVAAWVISATLTNDAQRSVTFALVIVLSIIVAIDLRRCVAKVLDDPRTFWNTVVPARTLRVR